MNISCFGCILVIGAGIFISPAGVAMKAQSGGLTILMWLAAGLVSLLSMKMNSELLYFKVYYQICNVF